jgi:hypothetical protein
MEAAGTGRYTYCFSNEMSTYARKILRYVFRLFWRGVTCFNCTLSSPK